MQLRVLQTTTVIKISSKSLHLILPGTQRSGLNQSVTQISWENSSTARVPFLRQRCKTKWFVDNCTVLLQTRNSTRPEAGDEWRSIHRFVCFLEFEYVIVKIRTIKIITRPWQWKSKFPNCHRITWWGLCLTLRLHSSDPYFYSVVKFTSLHVFILVISFSFSWMSEDKLNRQILQN